MIHRPSRAGLWFLAALVLTVLTAALQPYLRQTNNLSDSGFTDSDGRTMSVR